MADKLQQLIGEGLSSEINVDFFNLKNSAENFLNIVRKKLKQRKNWLNKYEKKVIAEQFLLLSNRMAEDKKLTQELMAAELTFSIQLNKFLERQIYLTIVNDDGTFTFLNEEIGMRKIYEKLSVSSSGGRGNVSKNVIKDILDEEGEKALAKLPEALQQKIEESRKKREKSYQKIIERMKGKEPKDRPGTSQRSKFWWYVKKENDFNFSNVTNIGWIGQTYLDMVVNQDKEFLDRKGQEVAIRYFASKLSRDRVAGLVEGDVKLKIDTYGKIHFASKTPGFSTESIGPSLGAAYWITKMSNITPSKLIEILPSIANIKLTDVAQTVVKQAEKELINNIKNII